MEIIRILMTAGLAAALAFLIAARAHAAGSAGPGEEPPLASLPTAQKKIEEREAKRREANAEHERRKQEFARRCSAPALSPAELEACRALYREM